MKSVGEKMLLLLASGLIVSQFALAQGGISFGGLDTNSDGSLSVEELSDLYNMAVERGRSPAPSAEDFFASVDTDGNGAVSEEEFDTLMSNR